MSDFALIACNMSDFAFIATVMFRAQSYWKERNPLLCFVRGHAGEKQLYFARDRTEGEQRLIG